MTLASLAWGLNYLNITYGKDDLDSLASVRDQPFMKLVTMVQKGGDSVFERFSLAGALGFSGNLTDAQAIALATNGGGSKFGWQHTFGRRVGSIQVNVEDIIQSNPAQSAAAKALEDEADDGIATEIQNINDMFMGRAGLALGKGTFNEAAVGDAPTFSVTFSDASEAKRFFPGTHAVVALGDATSAGTLTGEVGIVVERNVTEGWVRFAALTDPDTPANPGSWTNATEFYVYGLGMFSEDGVDEFITSYEQYLPETAATTILHGVDRSKAAELSGARLPTVQRRGTILSRARKLVALMCNRLGLKQKDMGNMTIVLNTEEHNEASEELESKGIRDFEKTTSEGYEGFDIRTAAGKVEVISEPGKRIGTGFIFDKRLLKIYTASGKMLETIPDGNGSVVQLMPGRNTYEIRTIAKPATGFGAPYMHGVFPTQNA